MATIQRSVESTSSGEILDNGFFNSKALPNGVVAVYLQDRLFKIRIKDDPESRIACAISLLQNLEHESDTTLQQLVQEKRIAALYIENGEIQSITLCPEQIERMREQGVKQIVFKMKNAVFIINEDLGVRSYASEEEYRNYTGLIQLSKDLKTYARA